MSMKLVKNETACACGELSPDMVPDEITEQDRERFFGVVSTDLADWQVAQVLEPAAVHHRQHTVLAVHWHPEFVPMDLITRRIEATFPNKRRELIIPTQHNELLTYGKYAGVEVDCYSSGFNQKVQLLLHFEAERIQDASVLKAMLAHTFKYRSSQLFEFMHTITKPVEDRLNEAARSTGADEDFVGFVRKHVEKIQTLIETEWDRIPTMSIKNKLLRNYFDTMREGELDNVTVNRIQAFLKEVKALVKRDFSLAYFYRASEIIEEARALGGGIVIPHPEQFWPILLAEYDVDGYEVWNPQSLRYTDFLISAVHKRNASRRVDDREILVFMGDDCHMGEKTRPLAEQSTEKAAREIGVQPAWDDLGVSKQLIVSGISRKGTIEEYKSRLAG